MMEIRSSQIHNEAKVCVQGEVVSLQHSQVSSASTIAVRLFISGLFLNQKLAIFGWRSPADSGRLSESLRTELKISHLQVSEG